MAAARLRLGRQHQALAVALHAALTVELYFDAVIAVRLEYCPDQRLKEPCLLIRADISRFDK